MDSQGKTENIPPIARLSAFGELTSSELALLAGMAGPSRKLIRGQTVIREDEPQPRCYLLLTGWAASTITFRSGARQLLKIHMPGDLLGTPGMSLGTAVETVTAYSEVSVVPLALGTFRRLFEEAPRLAAILFLVSQEERVVLMDRIASLGRSKARERLATLILQLRSQVLRGDITSKSFKIPLTQVDFADLAGITAVHLNRVLQDLRKEGLVHWERGLVTILDLKGLQRLSGLPVRHSEYDPSWLPDAR